MGEAEVTFQALVHVCRQRGQVSRARRSLSPPHPQTPQTHPCRGRRGPGPGIRGGTRSGRIRLCWCSGRADRRGCPSRTRPHLPREGQNQGQGGQSQHGGLCGPCLSSDPHGVAPHPGTQPAGRRRGSPRGRGSGRRRAGSRSSRRRRAGGRRGTRPRLPTSRGRPWSRVPGNRAPEGVHPLRCALPRGSASSRLPPAPLSPVQPVAPGPGWKPEGQVQR